MNELEIRKYILDSDADGKHYFTSLVTKAREKGLIRDAEYSVIQEELLLILADRTFKFNDRKSSSVTVANAKGLLNSVIYTVGLKLKTCPSADAAVKALRSESVKDMFTEGNKIVHQKLNMCRSLQKLLLSRLFKTHNKFIRACLEDELNEFFETYQPDYFAQGDDLWFAYEPYAGFPDLAGIEFIEQYLRDADAENTFCLHFDSDDIHHLLCGITPEYPLAPMNIFEPVILSCIGLILNGRNPSGLDLSATDTFNIYDLFTGKTKDEIRKLILSACEKLPEYFYLEDNVKEYILRIIPKLIITVENAANKEILDKVFVRPAYPENAPYITMANAPGMSDVDYRMMISKLELMQPGDDRVSLILSSVMNTDDLTDAVHDAALTDKETASLVDRLEYKDFVLLYAKHKNSAFASAGSDKLIFDALESRKDGLSEEEKKQLESIIKALR